MKYTGYNDYTGTWETEPQIRAAFFEEDRSSLQNVCGSISSASHKKWFPETQWKPGGRGLVTVENHGTPVRDVDSGDKLVGFTGRKLLHLDGKEVRVFSRKSPLRYNGYYYWESIWLLEGETLPPEYPPVHHESDQSDSLFGTQADQASCIRA